MSSPRISVLIPNYNYARFLPAAVASVMDQDWSDFELLISDDASTDDSADVIRSLARKDSRINVHLHERNLGMVPHWNWCLQQARGAYVKFLFGDDVLVSPRALSRMADLLDRHPSANLASAGRLLIDESGRAIGLGEDIGVEGLRKGGWVSALCLRRCRNYVGEPTAVMLRRSAAGSGFDPDFRQVVDLEMWMRLLERGDLVHTREPLCGFRCHGAQQTEVNRVTRAGDAEMIRLVVHALGTVGHPAARYLGLWSRAQVVYRVLHNARKNGGTGAAAEAHALRRVAKLGPFGPWLGATAYAIDRPLDNAVRSLRKRQGRRAARAFADRRG